MYPDIEFGSSNYMVAWSDNRAGSYYRIYAARVNPQGAVLDPTGIAVGPNTSTYQYQPSLAYDDSRFFVIWGYATAPYAVTGRFINTDGSLTDTVRVASASTMVYNTRLVWSGVNYLAVWVEYVATGSLVRGQLVAGSGTLIGSPFTIATGVYYYNSLGVKYDGYNYIINYITNTTGTYQVWGNKYDTSGNPVGPAFRISQSNFACYYGDVVPGADNCYLNVWSEYRGTQYDIYGNLDVQIIGIEESTEHVASNISLVSAFVTRTIQLKNAEGIEVSVFDVSGRRLGSTHTGSFDCQTLGKGVYFVKSAQGDEFKVIKIK